ncbi:endospore germination permease [Paenibacillus sp. SI8]|uniref:GerAB/ArcD/ProY family transporter n=1 Tax=unclassified Paenibacillus TaxID=185978 RepID=UPI00346773A3
MDKKQVINQRQIAWLAASVFTSGGLFNWQNVLIRVSEIDAWFSYLLSIFYVFLIAAFFGYMAKLFPARNIFEISMLLLGRAGGTIVNLLMLFHFWESTVLDVSSMSRFTYTLLLHNTPIEILILVPCLLLIYFGRTSIEIIARVNDLFYPLFVIVTLLMPLLLANEFHLPLITPVLTMPFQNIASGNILALGNTGDIFILGAFLHTVYNAKQFRSSIRHGSMLGIFLFTLVIFLVLIVLGPNMPANFIYPGYNLVQMIHVTDFLDRVDLVLLTIWLPTLAGKYIVAYLAILIGINSMMNQRDYPIMNKPVALLFCLTTCLSFKSTTELLSFANFSSPVIVLAYQPLVMAILFAAAKIRHRKQPLENQHSEEDTNQKSTPSKQMARISMRFSYNQWLWCGNILILVCAFCVLMGLAFGKYSPLVGNVCALGFGSCLFLAVMTTYMEVSQLKQSQAGK